MKTTVLFSILAWAASPGSALSEEVSPQAAFDRLKGLAGRWEGSVNSPDGPRSTVEFRVTAAGKMVMETQFPGAPEEMVSIYYLDGDDLVAKHFCAMGNQPEMKLDPEASSENELHFAFTGGTNLDAARDVHVHGGKIGIKGDRLENEWMVFASGKQEGANRFYLTRAKN
jgi:hypothetical protein